MVTCSSCEKTYAPVFKGTKTQGYTCASSVHGDILRGHYGSVVADMTSYTVTGTALGEGSVICDCCITEMIDQGHLVEIVPERGNLGDLGELAGLLDSSSASGPWSFSH